MLLSLVVCTYNRSQILSLLLSTIAEQTLSLDEFEVIIVDNRSTDSTTAVVDRFRNDHNKISVRYYMEDNIGLSCARNRGWQEARGEYVAYVDDDCKLPPEWGAVAVDVIQRISPDLFGGPYHAFYLDAKPSWFKDSYGSHELSQTNRLLRPNEFLDGGNMVIKRSLLEQFGGFNNQFGMKGKALGYGEETEFFSRVHEKCPEIKVYYEPKLRVYHLVRKEKLLVQWNMGNSFVNGRSSFLLMKTQKKSPRLIACMIVIPLRSFLLCLDLIIGFVFRDQKKYPYFPNYLYEYTGPQHISKLGWWYQAFVEKLSKSPPEKLQDN